MQVSHWLVTWMMEQLVLFRGFNVELVSWLLFRRFNYSCINDTNPWTPSMEGKQSQLEFRERRVNTIRCFAERSIIPVHNERLCRLLQAVRVIGFWEVSLHGSNPGKLFSAEDWHRLVFYGNQHVRVQITAVTQRKCCRCLNHPTNPPATTDNFVIDPARRSVELAWLEHSIWAPRLRFLLPTQSRSRNEPIWPTKHCVNLSLIC